MIAKETNTTQKSFRDHVEVIIRRRRFFLVPLVVIFFGGLALSYLLPKEFQASSMVQINDKRILDPLVSQFAVSPNIRDQVDTMSKQIVSWTNLYNLVRQLQLVKDGSGPTELEDYIQGLQKRISISVRDKNMIEISYTDNEPQTAQQVVNALTQNFVSETSRRQREEARSAIDFISEQLKIYQKKLEDSQKNFSTFKIDSDLRQLLNRKRQLEMQMRNLKQIVPSQVRTEQSPVAARLNERMAELQMELSRLMLDAKEEHPRVGYLRNEIAKLKSAIDAEMRKETVRESVSTVNPLYAQNEQELSQVQMEIEFLMHRKEALSKLQPNPEQQVTDEELSTLETSTRVDQDIYQMLLRQIESAYVSERLQDSDKGSSFKVVEYARFPLRPTKPDRTKVILGGLFLGLMTGVGLVFLMEYLDRSFRTAEDAKKALKMQYLGSISRIVSDTSIKTTFMTKASDRLKRYLQRHKFFSDIRFVSPHIARAVPNSPIAPQMVIFHEPKSAVAEEYRIVRTNIQGHEPAMQTVVVTSAVRGEGKSTTTANLAISLADSGRDTLLIDCDLRKGTVHENLGIAEMPGLTEVLSQGLDPETVLVKPKVKHLTVMPCGSRPPNPSELLGSARMQRLLEAFRQKYEFIILDAPPVLNLPDARILGKYGDGVILIVQAERTQREDVLHAQAMLTQARSSIAGFVLTNVQYYIPKYVYDYLYGT